MKNPPESLLPKNTTLILMDKKAGKKILVNYTTRIDGRWGNGISIETCPLAILFTDFKGDPLDINIETFYDDYEIL